MLNFILIVIILVIAGAVIFYLYKAKKRGETCIGCPYARECAKRHGKQCGESGRSCGNTKKHR